MLIDIGLMWFACYFFALLFLKRCLHLDYYFKMVFTILKRIFNSLVRYFDVLGPFLDHTHLTFSMYFHQLMIDKSGPLKELFHVLIPAMSYDLHVQVHEKMFHGRIISLNQYDCKHHAKNDLIFQDYFRLKSEAKISFFHFCHFELS